MRAFVAIELPESLVLALEAAVAPVRARMPPARWVPPRNWHLTLLFLGLVEAADLGALDDALGAAFRREPEFELELRECGAFPAGRPGRVVWIGVSPNQAVLRLQAAIAEACAALGYEREGRVFSPHLTLARAKAPWPREAVEAWHGAGVTAAIPQPIFVVGRGCLFESVSAPGGVHYEAIRSYPLNGRTTET